MALNASKIKLILAHLTCKDGPPALYLRGYLYGGLLSAVADIWLSLKDVLR